MKRLFPLLLVASSFLPACTHEAPRTKYLLPRGYVGVMIIYFNRPNGQKEIDKDGRVVDRVSDKGECFSAFPFTEGWSIPHKTNKFYEVYSKDSMTEFDEFFEKEYFDDPVHNTNRKYAFFHSSGFEDNTNGTGPHDFVRYYIDSGKNYKKY